MGSSLYSPPTTTTTIQTPEKNFATLQSNIVVIFPQITIKLRTFPSFKVLFAVVSAVGISQEGQKIDVLYAIRLNFRPTMGVCDVKMQLWKIVNTKRHSLRSTTLFGRLTLCLTMCDLCQSSLGVAKFNRKYRAGLLILNTDTKLTSL